MPFFFVLADFTFFSFLFFFLGLFYQYAKDVCFNIPRFNFQIAYLFSILENYGCFPVHAIREGTGTTARQPYGSAVPAKVLKLFLTFPVSYYQNSRNRVSFISLLSSLIRRSFYAPCHSRLMLPVSTCRLGCISFVSLTLQLPYSARLVPKHLFLVGLVICSAVISDPACLLSTCIQ